MMLAKIEISEKIYLPIFYILIAIILYAILSKLVDRVLIVNKFNKKRSAFQEKREKTIVNLIKSIIKYIIAVIALLSILNVYGIETKSIIASLGIAGAIIGLAFQDTIKSLLAGISIIFDNRYMQGDTVTINGFKGEVISLGLQTTKIKSYSGEVLVISNNIITSVINHSMYNSKLLLELPVSSNVSLKDIEKIFSKVINKIKDMKEVKGEITLQGIEKLNSRSYIYKIEIDCVSNKQEIVNREFMKLLKDEYEKNGIVIP